MSTDSRTSSSAALFDRACTVMPGGVNSPVRSFSAVGGRPPYVTSARGCELTDVDGNLYVDYVGSWGPMILGHAHPDVLEAVTRTAQHGTSFGTCCPLEVELAETIVQRIPSIDKVRMVNSGTEAVMSAIRLARAVTGREVIIKFEGCYHGHADALLVRSGSGLATLGLCGSPGVPAGCTADTLVAQYNDLESVERCLAAANGRVAAVAVEPVAGNMGVVPPAPGFLEGLRELTSAHSAILIFDEVMTGFRVAPGGAQQRYAVTPDLTILGKVIGGGLPVGAYGGPAALMDHVAPAGSVYQAGTLSGNPIAMAAGRATLQKLDDTAYATLESRSRTLAHGLAQALGAAGAVQRCGSMLTVFFGTSTVRNFADARAADHDRFATFFHRMLEQGYYLPPSGYEAWFVSLAHDDATIERTITAAHSAMNP